MKRGTKVPSTINYPSHQAGHEASSTEAFAVAFAPSLDQRTDEWQNHSLFKAFITHLETKGTVPKPTPAHKATFIVLAAFP